MTRTFVLSFIVFLCAPQVGGTEKYIQEDRSTMWSTTFAAGGGCFNHAGNRRDFCGPAGSLSKAIWGSTSQTGFSSIRLEARGDLILGQSGFVSESNSLRSLQFSGSLMAAGNLLLVTMGPKAAFGVDAGVGYAVVLQTGKNRALYSAAQFYGGWGFQIRGHYFGFQLNSIVGVFDDDSNDYACALADTPCDYYYDKPRGFSFTGLIKYARPF